MSYSRTTTVDRSYETVLAEVRTALADQGFGVLSEIDLRTTMKAKLDADIPPQVILGACRPPLALAALLAEPSIGLLLPCNVVVRSTGAQTTVVQVVDPQTMVSITGTPALQEIADDATSRLNAALASLAGAAVKRA